MKGGEDGGPPPLNAALDRLAAEPEDRPTVGKLLDDLGGASFGYLLFAPAAVVVTPLSGIPGLSSLCGITIALAAAQMLVGRSHIWLPQVILRRRIERRRLRKTLEWLRRPIGWLDRITAPRLEWLLRRPFVLGLQLACLFCGLAMPMLEVVPLSSSILAAAVAVLSVAMVTRDGVFALAGLAAVAAAIAVVAGLFAG